MLQVVGQAHKGIVISCARGNRLAIDKHHLAVAKRTGREALGAIAEHPAHRGRLATRNRAKMQARRLHGMNALDGAVAGAIVSSRNQRIVHIGQHKFDHKVPSVILYPVYCNDLPIRDRFILAGFIWENAAPLLPPAKINLSHIGRGASIGNNRFDAGVPAVQTTRLRGHRAQSFEPVS